MLKDKAYSNDLRTEDEPKKKIHPWCSVFIFAKKTSPGDGQRDCARAEGNSFQHLPYA